MRMCPCIKVVCRVGVPGVRWGCFACELWELAQAGVPLDVCVPRRGMDGAVDGDGWVTACGEVRRRTGLGGRYLPIGIWMRGTGTVAQLLWGSRL